MDYAIITHKNPHLDELVAAWLLKKFGESRYPGISQASVDFWERGIDPPRDLYEMEKNGGIFLGMFGGKFDDHADMESGKEECCTTLVVKNLGLGDNPALTKLVQFVFKTDTKPCAQPFDLSSVIKSLNKKHKAEQVWMWVSIALEALYEEQCEFFQDAARDFDKARKTSVRYRGRMTYPMVVAETDVRTFSKYARSSLGCGAGVIVQRNSSGNVQIFTNEKYGIELTEVARILRVEEQRKRGQLNNTNWEELKSTGSMGGAEEWFFHENRKMLLNGSLSTSEVEPTALSLKEIEKCVKQGLDQEFFPRPCNKEKKCLYGQCFFYAYGLHRCRKLRYKDKARKGKKKEAVAC